MIEVKVELRERKPGAVEILSQYFRTFDTKREAVDFLELCSKVGTVADEKGGAE